MSFSFDLENLPPSELKKLRNKQRKALKKAELESAQAKEAQVKKEQHNKSRQNNQDGDPEAPQLDELIPDKLARPENPLEKGIEFLKPLQVLAMENIETHLLAFEIYYRKNKVLLMLQSIKRARAIDRDNARLHLNLVKFSKVLQSLKKTDQNEFVKTVIEKEIVGLFDGKSAKELNENVLKQNGGSFAHVFNVAKAMYVLDSNAKEQAVKLTVNFPMEKLTLQVIAPLSVCRHTLNFIHSHCRFVFFSFQDASLVLNTLKDGSFGVINESDIDAYKSKCSNRFIHAALFRDGPVVTAAPSSE